MRLILQVLMLILTLPGFAQDGTLDLSFGQPMGAHNGEVMTTYVQTDGKVLVGGNFTLLNNVVSNRMARLNADGTTDASFSSGLGFNNAVYGITVQVDGKIVAVGDFTSYNGAPANKIVRLNPDGRIDSSFSVGAGANDIIFAAAVQADGKILAVGRFSSFNSVLTNRMIRINSDGTADSTFKIAPGPNSGIESCTVQPDGKILVSGSFTMFNDTARSRIARLNPDGTLDATFTAGGVFNDNIKTVCLQQDGKIIIGGNFKSYNGMPVNYIARLNVDSSLDAAFNSGGGFDYAVNSIVIQKDGKLVVGGNFYSYNNTGCRRIARINSDGSIDADFSLSPTSGTDAPVNTVAVQADGKILLGGAFTKCNNFSRNRLASLNTDGTNDTSFYPFLENGLSTNGQIRDIAVQPDGKILIGGFFTSYRGISSKNIARLNADGTWDSTFKVGAGADGLIKKVVYRSNNKIIIGGDFKTYNGVPVVGIAQLNIDGSIDSSFNAGGSGLNGNVNTISIQSDGKMIIGGDFDAANGLSRVKLVRLNTDGSADASFTTGLGHSGTIWTSAIQSDGKIIIGGLGFVCNNISIGSSARLNADGSLDTAFNPGGAGANYFVYSSAVQPDGKIVLGGSFDTYNKVPSKGVVRLNADGSLDTPYNVPELLGNATVNSSAVQKDGKIIFGGRFSYYTTTTGWNIMRLNTDGTLDTSFHSGNGFNALLNAVVLQNDGKILAGGSFSSYNKNYIDYIARLNNSSAPFESGLF